jgi:hypothetical protein
MFRHCFQGDEELPFPFLHFHPKVLPHFLCNFLDIASGSTRRFQIYLPSQACLSDLLTRLFLRFCL